MKKNMKFIILLVCVAGLIVAVDFFVPKKIDWTPDFSKDEKIPYGSRIPFSLLPDLFPSRHIAVNYDSVYDSLKNRNLTNLNVIFVTTAFTLDAIDAGVLADFVNSGNNVFIAAHFFSGEFAKKLGVATEISSLISESTTVNFSSGNLKIPKGYLFTKNTAGYYFSSYPDAGAILGVNAGGKPNLIRVRRGRGFFYLSTLPYAYTNYNALYEDNAWYICKSLSYLPVRDTIWDEFYKPRMVAPSTPLRFILSRAPLAWAYYAGLATMILFIIFKARRKQRIIPVIEPLPNAMLDFVKTVGRLYCQQGDHRNIAGKKIVYFFDRLRSVYRDDSYRSRGDFTRRLSLHTGIPEKDIKNLFDYIHGIRIKSKIPESELLALSMRIEDFYTRAGI